MGAQINAPTLEAVRTPEVRGGERRRHLESGAARGVPSPVPGVRGARAAAAGVCALRCFMLNVNVKKESNKSFEVSDGEVAFEEFSTSKAFIGPIYKTENKQDKTKDYAELSTGEGEQNALLGRRTEEERVKKTKAISCDKEEIDDELYRFYEEIQQIETDKDNLGDNLEVKESQSSQEQYTEHNYKQTSCGQGKTTVSRVLLGQSRDGVVFSTDDYFNQQDGYTYNAGQLGDAHDWNQKRARQAMEQGKSPIIIDNTNTQAWEMKPYVETALEKGYIVEFREPDTWWKFDPEELEKRNKHGVTREKIAQMLDRYEYQISIPIVMNSVTPPHKSTQRPPPQRRQRETDLKKKLGHRLNKTKQRKKRKRGKKQKNSLFNIREKKSDGAPHHLIPADQETSESEEEDSEEENRKSAYCIMFESCGNGIEKTEPPEVSQIEDKQDSLDAKSNVLDLPLSLGFAFQLVQLFGSPGVPLESLLPDDYIVPLDWKVSKMIYFLWKTSVEEKQKKNGFQNGNSLVEISHLGSTMEGPSLPSSI
ncbi:NEDD4-binding protein 2-like 2 isoform B [Alligator mississippiensis]|uniref:NEDD4-binding protein 2-like 2 isoform B n=1 Tax=Alligator mississippiensis TaxID=8496 RepID=A0A151MPK4_ALLMI|nr:NEDD4-binding protein 2-like 2 isoform B [Alligator mississippiensis]